jgi:organic radical activating enzyme
MHGKENTELKESMLKDKMPFNCSGCHLQEKNRSNLSSISSRLYYLKELGTTIDLNFYDNVENFSLKHIDLRWTNSCNQACVYCGPEYSSKWAKELGVKVKSDPESRKEVKDFVFENITDLKNVYLAGGEPMLMKENYQLLKLLKEKNPSCSIRVNTNLSTTETGIFDLLCSFENVHWTVSVETIEDEYENPQGYLKNSFENLIKYYTTTKFERNIKKFYSYIDTMDRRRSQNSRATFPELFKELDAYVLE